MKIVFLGDSCTDMGRNTDNGSQISIGQGYPMILCSKMTAAYPSEYEFINSAVSGRRIVDIYAGIKKDCWNLKPDVVSVLCGINDVWHELGDQNGVDAKRFETVYRMMVSDTLERFPHVKFLLLEPFVLRSSATEENWDYFSTEVALRQKAVEKVAGEYGQIFVPLQEKLEQACQKAPASHWLADGVHPMPAGAQLIADAWLDAFSRNIQKL